MSSHGDTEPGPPEEPAGGTVDVIVEVPAGTRNKYEVDDRTGTLRLTRRLPATFAFPADYGYIPETLSEDGDPLDALVMLGEPATPGCKLRVVPLGVLWVTDENGRDPKVVTVLEGDAAQEGLSDLSDLPRGDLEAIEHFFDVYKNLEPGGDAVTDGWADRRVAEREIAAARAAFARRDQESTQSCEPSDRFEEGNAGYLKHGASRRRLRRGGSSPAPASGMEGLTMVAVRKTIKALGRVALVTAGAALGYYLDPHSGGERRRQLRDELTPALRQVTTSVRDKVRPSDASQSVRKAA
jgi:inorganic pyrophosphatase